MCLPLQLHQNLDHLPRLAQFATTKARVSLAGALLVVLMLTACGGSSPRADPTATPMLAVPTVAPTVVPTEAPAASEVEATEGEAIEGEVTDAEVTDAEVTEVETSEATAAPAASEGEILSFQIDPEQSEARFIVDEVLFGNPNTVVGRTNAVSGQIEINLADPSQTTVGEIQIDARSLVTDNRFRNRSLSRMILQSNRDEYQFVTFTPTAMEGLPDAAAAGDTFEFQIAGDLRIREIVQPTTFAVSVTADSATQISGLAQATVTRADFELEIPEVDGVADVSEEVQLELEFVATASE